MTYQIHQWFPKTVYLVDDVALDCLDKMETQIKNQQSLMTDMLVVASTHKTNDQLHKIDEFNELVNSIYHHSSNLLKELGFNQEFISRTKIANMWANVSQEGEFLFPHVHSNSVLSGAFYIKTNGNNKLRFFNNINDMFPRASEANHLNYEYCDYDCKPGRLIMFKSDFLHGTIPQTAGEKIVVSFNIALEKNI
jgi:uncharacterized protein (TIGR02466 family)